MNREKMLVFLEETANRHDHVCPRQVLGVRMGMLAAKLLDLDLPQTNKRLLTLVETDGCFADGIAAATGCEFGRRTLRLMDYGKVAATFIDTKTEQAVRIFPHYASRDRAREIAADARSRWHAYLEAYKVIPDDNLLIAQPVTLNFDLHQLISKPGHKTVCDRCNEEIINEREVHQDGQTLCRACAQGSYYRVNIDVRTTNEP